MPDPTCVKWLVWPSVATAFARCCVGGMRAPPTRQIGCGAKLPPRRVGYGRQKAPVVQCSPSHTKPVYH